MERKIDISVGTVHPNEQTHFIQMRLNQILRTILVMIVLIPFVDVYPQERDRQIQLQNQIYSDFINGDVTRWEGIIGEFERLYQSRRETSLLYDLLLARYGFIAFTLEKEPAKARFHLDKAESELEQLLKFSSYRAHSLAMQGAFLGFRISLRPISAVVLGPRSYSALNKAMEADATNPVVLMEMGNSRFYTPAAFGGSKQQALNYYSRSVEFFEKDLKNNQRWLYLNTLVGLAKTYQFLGDKNKAIATYNKALDYEPRFKWVRDDLLPEISR
jgi:tetratricopeptide (TPR) repeat protein